MRGAAPGHFRASDAGLLRTYCASVVRRDVIKAELEAWIAKRDKQPGETSLLVKGPRGGLAPHPAYRLLSVAERELRGLAAELGLSPTSRERVHATEEPTLFDDGWASFGAEDNSEGRETTQ